MSAKSSFEVFEHQFLKLVGELKHQSDTVCRLREALGAEASRAEAAAAARDSAVREAAEARAEAAATAAGAAKLGAAMAVAHDELASAHTRIEIVEREKCLLEQRAVEVMMQLSATQRELEALRARNSGLDAQRAAMSELQERAKRAMEEATSTAQHLESELRRVERAAAAGAELRERARLAAVAHARERRLAGAELRHTVSDLLAANAEISRLTVALKETREQADAATACAGRGANGAMFSSCEWESCVNELRGALETERAGAARLERALAALAADIAALSAAAAAERAPSAAAAAGDAGPLSSPRRDAIATGAPADTHLLPPIKAIDSFLEE